MYIWIRFIRILKRLIKIPHNKKSEKFLSVMQKRVAFRNAILLTRLPYFPIFFGAINELFPLSIFFGQCFWVVGNVIKWC